MFDIPMNRRRAILLGELENARFARSPDRRQPPPPPPPRPGPPPRPAPPPPRPAPPPPPPRPGPPLRPSPPPPPRPGPPRSGPSFRPPPPPPPPPPRHRPPPPPPPPVQRRPVRSRPPATGAILQKGQKTSLSQLSPGLDFLEVGLGWDLGPNGQCYELDAEAFLLDATGRVLGDNWFVFYNQPVSPDGAVHLLDSRVNGAGWGDDETFQVNLRQLNPNVTKIVFILTIHEARQRGYHFGNVANAYIRIVDKPAGRELVRFPLTEYYTTVCSMVVGELYRHQGEWRFNPVGNGTGDDLQGLCVRYGVQVSG